MSAHRTNLRAICRAGNPRDVYPRVESLIEDIKRLDMDLMRAEALLDQAREGRHGALDTLMIEMENHTAAIAKAVTSARQRING